MNYYKLKTISNNKMWHETKLYRQVGTSELEFYLNGRWVVSAHRNITAVMYVSRFSRPQLIECTEDEIVKELTIRELGK